MVTSSKLKALALFILLSISLCLSFARSLKQASKPKSISGYHVADDGEGGGDGGDHYRKNAFFTRPLPYGSGGYGPLPYGGSGNGGGNGGDDDGGDVGGGDGGGGADGGSDGGGGYGGGDGGGGYGGADGVGDGGGGNDDGDRGGRR